MCEACWGSNGESAKVPLTRMWPRNRGTTPVEWLEGHDESLGHYEEIDRVEIPRNDEDYEIVGWRVTYGGVYLHEHSQEMFTLKALGADTCHRCEGGMPPDIEVFHVGSYQTRTFGCKCGNIAYTGKLCPEHPAPSATSRWVVKGIHLSQQCQMCKKILPQETWESEILWFCNRTCFNEFEEFKRRREEQWRAKGRIAGLATVTWRE